MIQVKVGEAGLGAGKGARDTRSIYSTPYKTYGGMIQVKEVRAAGLKRVAYQAMRNTMVTMVTMVAQGGGLQREW